MIFTMAQLQQAVLHDGSIAAHAGTVQAHTTGLQVVDTQQLAAQLLLKRLPACNVAHGPQDRGQSIIADIACLHCCLGTLLQPLLTMLDPGLHLIHAMIRL